MFWFNPNPFRVYNAYRLDVDSPRAFIIPHYTCPNTFVGQETNEFFTITFWPGKMRHLFRYPWLEILNHYIPLEDTGDKSVIDFSYRIEDTTSLSERVQLCDDFLLSRLPRHLPQQDQMQQAMDLLTTNHQLTVKSLAKKVYLSERQFRRRYKETFGVAPGGHRRLIRFLRTYNWMKRQKSVPLIEATERFHYIDPSHLYKDFKHFTGKAPKQYLQHNKWHKLINWRENYWD